MAGLSAAIQLARAGMRVAILEARDRIGGRVFTEQDPMLHHPVELGAEFVHGLGPEIWGPAQQHNLKMIEVDGDLWCSLEGKLQRCNFFSKADKILEAMNDRVPDESFVNFLTRKFPGNDLAEARQWATGYVSGFNAANPEDVSVHWLAHSRDADEKIEGDRAFRIAGGYQQLLDIFAAELERLKVPVHLNTVVREIRWSGGAVKIDAGHDLPPALTSAKSALITLPLGVLQAGSVRFDPQLAAEKQTALQRLAMGKVVRVTLCFQERFWERIKPEGEKKTMGDLSFLFSRHEIFRTWWTEMPEHAPMITAWAPARSAELLAGLNKDEVVGKAVETLGSVLGTREAEIRRQLAAAYFHDWDSDPFSSGAYSYVKAGGEGYQRILGAPVENTLFFAGEATDVTGHNGTVHGAIASGARAARELLAALGAQKN